MPNGAEENFRWGDSWEPPSFLQGKVGYRIAPSSAPVCALGHLPPEGKALGRWERSEAVVGLFRAPCLSPDLESFFHKNAFQHIFPRKCVPNRSWYIGGNCPSAVSEITTTKTSEWERAAIKTRVQGGALVFFPPTFFKESRAPPPESAGNPRCRVHPATVPTEPPTDDRGPRPSFSPFLGRNGDPRRSRRGPRGAAPQGGFGGTPPEGTQHRAAPGRWSGFGPAQVQTCNVGSRPVPGGGSRLSLEKARTQRVAGEDPRPPFFRARSFPLARFGGCCPGSVRGAVSSEILRPIWDAFPGKIC